MFAVIFEVQPNVEEMDTYLDLAKMLRPELEQIEGFIDNERFTSEKTEGRLLSLSTWRDEKALIRWRTLGVHHNVQKQGRSRVFADYHLRVGEITTDSQSPQGQQPRQERFDTTAVGKAQMVTITEAPPGAAIPSPDVYDGADGLVDWGRYDGITIPGKGLWLASWRDEAALAAWYAGQTHPAPAASAPVARFRAVRIIRDYGMHDRREAPQYYPPVTATASTPHGDHKARGER
ncbi:MAG: antibiotic biosynthesis monooxygenase [Chloroflexota bacterium]|nr:antibiotic biosynthesis monooxygenase [Chloroflexota bacterium]